MFLSHGDEVWVADNIYGPNMEHLRHLEKSYGIIVQVYNPIDVDSFQPNENAKLIWLEAAGSVTLEFPDLVNLVKKSQSKENPDGLGQYLGSWHRLLMPLILVMNI